MSRYTGPMWKKSRRLGVSLLGTGKELERRPYAPGQHGPNSRRKVTEYGLQLREKQKLRLLYGMNERQFFNLFTKASKIKEGKQGTNFMILLEQRLDNLVYRLGFASTRRHARQLVNHGHILVDGKKVDIPSFQVQPGQVIEVKERSRKMASIAEAMEATVSTVNYVTFDKDTFKGEYVRLPERSELNQELNEALVVEFYNR